MHKALKTVAMAVMVAVCASAADIASADVVTYVYYVAKDNFNDTLIEQNWGATKAKRFAKARQETTWYGAWTTTDLADIAGRIAGLHPGDYRLSFRIASNEWGSLLDPPNGNGPNFTPSIAAFFSLVDWAEYQATNRVASTGQAWLRDDTGAGVTFWGLRDIGNSALVVGGWQTPTTNTPSLRPGWNSAVLDAAVVDALLNRTDCRGLRAWDQSDGPGDTGWYNDICMARGRWGDIKLSPQLLLEIPEPATLLLALGGAFGLLARRRP